MVVSLRRHEGTAPLMQWYVREGVEGIRVVTLEDTKDLFDVSFATWWQVVNLSHDFPCTRRCDVQEEVAIVTNWICVGPMLVQSVDQGDAAVGTTHEVLGIEFVVVSHQGVLVVQVNSEITLCGEELHDESDVDGPITA